MRNLNIGDEVGYLNERTGGYKFVTVVAVLNNGAEYAMNEIIRQGRRGFTGNIYTEQHEKIDRFCHTKDNEGLNKNLLKVRFNHELKPNQRRAISYYNAETNI